MSTDTPSPLNHGLFARLLFDVMIPAELAKAIQSQEYEEPAREQRAMVACYYG